ncbi:hypothetical protein DL89DRAFT_121115 [Linderina pennispora]|uniref:Uncharacterized protein n=1 Tax=Linderina pennispora TaxID=61395 RepID=A0A1Y1WCS6_9FUNG|nr:uncharacterized protein DL89DRAFT_121115 [Linderina pennispora]ORX71175.1 hypothetical protein DL89DRAFT_121115 [Linderina pennispora]
MLVLVLQFPPAGCIICSIGTNTPKKGTALSIYAYSLTRIHIWHICSASHGLLETRSQKPVAMLAGRCRLQAGCACVSFPTVRTDPLRHMVQPPRLISGLLSSTGLIRSTDRFSLLAWADLAVAQELQTDTSVQHRRGETESDPSPRLPPPIEACYALSTSSVPPTDLASRAAAVFGAQRAIEVLSYGK